MDAGERELDEIGRLWRSQTPPGDWDREGVLAHVRRTSRQLDRAVFWRNVREAVAGAIAVAAMGVTSWLAPGWTPKLGVVIVAASFAFVLLRLARARRRHPPSRPDLPLAAWLEAELHKVEAESRLLLSVRSWYVAPIAFSATIWGTLVVSQGLASLPISRARFVLAMSLCLVLSVGMFAAIAWGLGKLNRSVAERFLAPHADELRRLLDDLRSGS